MNIEDIKVGETYNVRMLVTKISERFFYTKTKVKGIMEGYCFHHSEAEVFSPISPENGIKNTEPAPKYDPCRLFRKGDKVKIVNWNGREPHALNDDGYCVELAGKELEFPADLRTLTYEIRDDEREDDSMLILTLKGYRNIIIYPCFVELVTPVEEIDPYEVRRVDCYWSVIDKNGVEMSRYWLDLHPHAKEAAEAECARLNAEYRKEQK